MKKQSLESWVKTVDCAEIPTLIHKAFDFLVDELNFNAPVTKNISSIVYTLSYRSNQVAIEPLVDRKDAAVEVLLVRLDHGIRPKGWKIDSNGNLFGVRLFEACWHRKIPSPRANIPAGTPGRQQLELLLSAEVDTLRRHFDDILHDSDTLFMELNEKRKKESENGVTKRGGPKRRLP